MFPSEVAGRNGLYPTAGIVDRRDVDRGLEVAGVGSPQSWALGAAIGRTRGVVRGRFEPCGVQVRDA